MADYTNEPEMGGMAFDPALLMRVAGATVSLGLLVGMGVWGYNLVVRDATGIPVVRAMDGPMRETPANPGGTLPLNTGLAVNEVAAQGSASEPEDAVLLAPQTAALTEEDLLTQPTAEAEEMAAGDVTVAPAEVALPAPEVSAASLGTQVTDPVVETPNDGPMTADQILALADEISEGVAPLEALANGEIVPPTLTIDGAEVAATPAIVRISETVPGVTVAYRPPARPAALTPTPAMATTAEVTTLQATTASAVDVATLEAVEAAVAETVAPVQLTASTPLVVGTSLVQLGAFDTSEEARDAWISLVGNFSDFMMGKEMIIQEAVSGGSNFYRLRAIGFDDIADARRFCTVLEAEQAACVPVMVQ